MKKLKSPGSNSTRAPRNERAFNPYNTDAFKRVPKYTGSIKTLEASYILFCGLTKVIVAVSKIDSNNFE